MVVCNEGDGTSKTTTEQPRDNMCGAQHMDSFREIQFAMPLAQGCARSSFTGLVGSNTTYLKKKHNFDFFNENGTTIYTGRPGLHGLAPMSTKKKSKIEPRFPPRPPWTYPRLCAPPWKCHPHY